MMMVALIAALFAMPALAQCDLTWTMDLTYKGEKVSTNTRTLYDLDARELKAHMTRGMRVLQQMAREHNKGGGYTLTLGEQSSCDSKKNDPVVMQGLTMKGVTKFIRESAKADNQMSDDYDARASRGKKRAWGKE